MEWESAPPPALRGDEYELEQLHREFRELVNEHWAYLRSPDDQQTRDRHLDRLRAFNERLQRWREAFAKRTSPAGN